MPAADTSSESSEQSDILVPFPVAAAQFEELFVDALSEHDIRARPFRGKSAWVCRDNDDDRVRFPTERGLFALPSSEYVAACIDCTLQLCNEEGLRVAGVQCVDIRVPAGVAPDRMAPQDLVLVCVYTVPLSYIPEEN
jgi:hypothetical protein